MRCEGPRFRGNATRGEHLIHPLRERRQFRWRLDASPNYGGAPVVREKSDAANVDCNADRRRNLPQRIYDLRQLLVGRVAYEFQRDMQIARINPARTGIRPAELVKERRETITHL